MCPSLLPVPVLCFQCGRQDITWSSLSLDAHAAQPFLFFDDTYLSFAFTDTGQRGKSFPLEMGPRWTGICFVLHALHRGRECKLWFPLKVKFNAFPGSAIVLAYMQHAYVFTFTLSRFS